MIPKGDSHLEYRSSEYSDDLSLLPTEQYVLNSVVYMGRTSLTQRSPQIFTARQHLQIGQSL